MIKGSIQEEDITIVNIYAPNIGTPQYKQTKPNKQQKTPKKPTVQGSERDYLFEDKE